jgi:hypothetical protein
MTMAMATKDISETTTTTNDTTIKRLPPESFVYLVTSRNFDRIIAILTNKRYRRSELLFWILCAIPHKNLVLHYILPYQPPVEIVHVIIRMLLQKTKSDIEKMKRKRPNLPYNEELLAIAPESTIDSVGHVPLHVAASNGCDVQIIYQLLKAQSDDKSSRNNAMCRDYSDRLPLHSVCCNLKGVRNFDSNLLSNKDSHNSAQKKGGGGWGFTLHGSQSYNSKMQKENMYKVVEALLLAYPEAVMLRDSEGKRPIDIARSNKADTSILQLLQDFARKQRRIQDSVYKPSCNLRQSMIQSAFNHNEQYNSPMDENHWKAENTNGKLLDLVITVGIDGSDSVSTLGSFYAEKDVSESMHQSHIIAAVGDTIISPGGDNFNLENNELQYHIERGTTVNNGSECFSKAVSMSIATATTRPNTITLTPTRTRTSVPTGSIAVQSMSSSSHYYANYNNSHNPSSISDTACSSIYHTRLISDTQVEC